MTLRRRLNEETPGHQAHLRMMGRLQRAEMCVGRGVDHGALCALTGPLPWPRPVQRCAQPRARTAPLPSGALGPGQDRPPGLSFLWPPRAPICCTCCRCLQVLDHLSKAPCTLFHTQPQRYAVGAAAVMKETPGTRSEQRPRGSVQDLLQIHEGRRDPDRKKTKGSDAQ